MESQVVTETMPAVAQERVITVVSTRGDKKKVPFTGSKWSELRATLLRAGVVLDNMKPVEGVKKHTLEHEDAVIPEGNFNLFLMPYKSKAGATGPARAEMYAKMKAIIEKDPSAKEYFGNYTQTSTAAIETLLAGYKAKGGSAKVTTKAEDKAEKKEKKKDKKEAKTNAVADVISNVKEHKLKGRDLFDEVHSLSVGDKLTIAVDILSDIRTLLQQGNSLGGAVATPSKDTGADVEIPKETDEQREARLAQETKEREEKEAAEKKAAEERAAAEEKARLEKEEDDKLAAEMEALSGGFNDVDKAAIKRKSRGY